MVNSPWKSNELPPSGETDSGTRPTVKNLGDTHIAMKLERYTPSLRVPLKSQMIPRLLLKHGPLMNSCVPPSIVPTDGNTTRFPVLKKAEEKRVKQVIFLMFFLPICSDTIVALKNTRAVGVNKT